jgi:hypothetical protein
MSKDDFLFHYSCEWDTTEFLGWDEVWICIEQLYGQLEAENEKLKKAGYHLYQNLSDYGSLSTPGSIVFNPDQKYKDKVLKVWEKVVKQQ